MSTCIHARKCVIDSDTDEHRRKQTPSDTRTCCPMGVALSLKSCTLWAQKFEALNPSRSAFLQLLSSFIALFSCSPVPPFLFLRLLFVRKRVSLMNFDSSKVKLCPTTSSTAQGGGGSFKNRKPIGEVCCCESGMAKRSHSWIERWLISLTILSFSDYLPTYLPIYLSTYLSIYRSIYLSISLSLPPSSV